MFFLDRGPSDPDQAGARDLAAGRRRGVVIGRREGEAGLRRRRREAPERSRRPEALPDFIRRRKLWSERKRRRNGPACQAARPKAVPHTRSLRPHFAPKTRARRSLGQPPPAYPTIRRALRASVAGKPDNRLARKILAVVARQKHLPPHSQKLRLHPAFSR